MGQVQNNRGPSAAAGAVLRRRRSRRAPAATTLVIALMGCTNPMQTESGAPPPGRLKLNVADAALAAGAPDMALRVAELILQGEPRNVPALVSKGDALYAMNLPDRARAAYRAALAVDPSSVDALIGLGRTLVRSDPNAAAEAFGGAAARAPNNVAALSNLGIARDLQGQHEAAQAAYRQALAVAPSSADVKLNLGLSLALSGKPAEAVALLRPLAGQIDSAGVRRNDLAAALALAGDQVEAGLVQRGEAQLAVANAPPAATVPAETPLVALANPVQSHAAATPDKAVAPALDIRAAPVAPVMEVPGVAAPIRPVTVPAETLPVASVTPIQGHVAAAADNGVVPPLDIRPVQVVSVTEAPGVGAHIRPATVPAAALPVASVTPIQGHVAAAADNALVPPRDVRSIQVVSVTEAPGVGAPIRSANVPAETPPVASATPVLGHVATAGDNAVVPPRDVRPIQVVSVTEAPGFGTAIRPAMVPAETPPVASATPVVGHVATAVDNAVVPPRDVRPTQVVSVTEAPGIGTQLRPPTVPAATLPVASATPVQGHVTTPADNVVVPRLDVRPTQVVSVSEAPGAGAAIQPATRVAFAPIPPQAQVWPSRRPDSAHEEPAATATGVSAAGNEASPAQAHHVAAALPRPASTVADTPMTAAAPAPSARTQVASAPVPQARIAPSDQSSQRFCQLAALDTEQHAMLEWQHLRTQIPELLDGRTPAIMPAEVHGRTFWRLRTGGFQTQAEQRDFCSHVRMLGLDCWWG